MVANKLLLNPLKTKFLLLGSPQQLGKFYWLKCLKLGDSLVHLGMLLVALVLFFMPLCLSLTM